MPKKEHGIKLDNRYSGQAVIFIPGIKGTTLVNTNRTDYDTIWSAVQSQFEDLNQLEMSFGAKGQLADTYRDTIISPGQLEAIVYREFIHDLSLDKPVYLFNYDWRRTSHENAGKLQSFMDKLQAKSKISEHFKTPIKRFDVITHSQGSAVLRQLSGLEGFKRIGRVIMAAPPLQGSLDILDIVLTGEGFFPSVRGRIRKLLRTIPGGLEILPLYTGALFEDGTSADYFNMQDWQKNITSKANNYSRKFTQAIEYARKSRKLMPDLDKLSSSIRNRILIIARDGYPTAQSLRVYRKLAGEPDNFVDLENLHMTSDGDGRVPHISSCCWHQKILTLMATDSWRYRDYGHGFLLKDERIQKVMTRFLTQEQFDWGFPGHSIKKVSALVEKQHPETNLPYWETELV